MKLELVKVVEFGNDPYYKILKDGLFVTGSAKLEKAEELLQMLINNGGHTTFIEVLKTIEL